MPRLPGLENDINPHLGLTTGDLSNLAKRIWHHYLGEGSLNYPIGTHVQEVCTNALMDLGFDRVSWASPKEEDDLLILCLWYRTERNPTRQDQVIIQFFGHDASSMMYFLGFDIDE